MSFFLPPSRKTALLNHGRKSRSHCNVYQAYLHCITYLLGTALPPASNLALNEVRKEELARAPEVQYISCHYRCHQGAVQVTRQSCTSTQVLGVHYAGTMPNWVPRVARVPTLDNKMDSRIGRLDLIVEIVAKWIGQAGKLADDIWSVHRYDPSTDVPLIRRPCSSSPGCEGHHALSPST